MKLISQSKKKITLKPLVTEYYQKMMQVRKFQSENERIFTKFHILQEELEVAENQLRTESKKTGQSYDDGVVTVEYVMPNHSYLDPEIVETIVPEKIRKAMGIITFRKEVDEKVLKAVIKAGKVDKSILIKALVKEPTDSPRVTIKIKETS
jgi:hypothetical protein